MKSFSQESPGAGRSKTGRGLQTQTNLVLAYLDACASGRVDPETAIPNGICYESQGFTFVCGQVEEAPTTGHTHVQLHFSLLHPATRGGLNRKLQGLGISGLWLDPIRARSADGSGVNPQANIDYCTKPDKRHAQYPDHMFEWGEKPRNVGKRGGRSDLDKLAEDLRNGKSFRTIATKHTKAFIRYHAGIEKLAEFFRPSREVNEEPPEVYWFYGSTGTGKSRAISEIVGETAYWKSAAHHWWDGYRDQTDVVIDDYRADFCKFHDLLSLLDRYPYDVQYKGGVRRVTFKRLFISTPHDPMMTWANRCSEDLAQLSRRITRVVEFKADMNILEKHAHDNFLSFLKSKTPVVLESDDEDETAEAEGAAEAVAQDSRVDDEPDGESLGVSDTDSDGSDADEDYTEI